ncbi:MAG: Fic family protein [Campylobacterota bacterium]|nr:Fic family protein [Campylobacterota bacterium]
MFNYIKLPYSIKLKSLLEKFRFSTKLAQELEVGRMSIPNWIDDDVSINNENKLKIDVLYCKTFGFDSINLDEIINIENEINKIDFSYFNNNEVDIVDRISKTVAFGSLEIEEDINEKSFNKVVEKHEMVKDMDKREMLSINNLANLTVKVINDTINDTINDIDTREIKTWHYMLMNGIRTDAGEYSQYKRIIPGSEELTLTDYRDIPEELKRWTEIYNKKLSLIQIATAHAHFELIHPFGDGNGRLGRLLTAYHCIKSGYIPPLINNSNKALYYVFLKHAQVNNEYGYLSYFIGTSILNMHKKFF